MGETFLLQAALALYGVAVASALVTLMPVRGTSLAPIHAGMALAGAIALHTLAIALRWRDLEQEGLTHERLRRRSATAAWPAR